MPPHPSLPDPALAPLADEDFLVSVLSSLTSTDDATVRQRFEKEKRSPGVTVREALAACNLKPHVWQDSYADFYQQTDAFLFETLVWNRNPVKIQMRQWIGEYLRHGDRGPVRILTFGDGLGIDSLYLTQAGHAVDSFEVSEPCIRFARALGDRMGTAISIIDSPDAIAPESYDVVVCLDVLEHVPEPGNLVKQLAGYLKPGGRLIVHAPFWFVHPAVTTHLAANRTYSGDLARLYRPHGFRPIDGQFFWSPIVLEKSVGMARRTAVPWGKRFSLGVGGLLLSVARYWNWPHLVIAGLTVNSK
jgi:2-polyprenyl-3-methyl-5-hydroxy-6-metoxy-1,4-benzoquinol methylase